MPKWRRDSTFGPGKRVPLDREQRAVFKAKLDLAHRPGRLTSSCVLIALKLVGMLGADGRLDPSLQTIADLAHVDRSTVVRSLARLRQFGFLDWTRRLVRDAGTGWRCEQASNAYVLVVPTCEAHSAPEVQLRLFRKPCRQQAEQQATMEAARENAARQLRALGVPIPPAWGLG